MAMTVGKGLASFFGNALIQAGKMSYSKYLGEEQRAAAKEDRAEQEASKRKGAYEELVIKENMETRRDPNAPIEARKAATDFLNKTVTKELGRQDDFIPAEGGRGGVPNLGQVPGPYFGDPSASKTPDLPPGFQSWPPENKTAWLKKTGAIPDEQSPYEQARLATEQQRTLTGKAQAQSANALAAERRSAAELNKKKLADDDKNKKNWQVQQQIDVFKARNKNLGDELDQYRDEDFGGFKKESMERVAEIQEELEYNAEQMSKATGVPSYKDEREKQRIESYFQGILKMGIDEKKAYAITRAFQSYVQGGFTPEEADQMVYQKYIRRLK